MDATSLFPLVQLKVSTCPIFLPFSLPQRRETEARLGQVTSSFPVPSAKTSEASWKALELLGLFQRGTGRGGGGIWKNWALLLLPGDEGLEERSPRGKDAAAPRGCGEKDLGLVEEKKKKVLVPPPAKPPNL